jgi:hypothetical protein
MSAADQSRSHDTEFALEPGREPRPRACRQYGRFAYFCDVRTRPLVRYGLPIRTPNASDMARLPQRFARWAYGIIQVTVTTAVATAIATHQMSGFSTRFLVQWGVAWLASWLAMLPVVILVAPFVQSMVSAVTAEGRTDRP